MNGGRRREEVDLLRVKSGGAGAGRLGVGVKAERSLEGEGGEGGEPRMDEEGREGVGEVGGGERGCLLVIEVRLEERVGVRG